MSDRPSSFRCNSVALRWAASIWLLVDLSLSVAGAYTVPRLIIVGLIVMGTYSRWIVLGLWSVVPVLLVFQSARTFRLKRYFAGIGWLVVVALGIQIVWPSALVGERLRFYATKNLYDRVIADVEAGACTDRKWSVAAGLPKCGKPALVTFEWGGFLSSWFGVVYDADDEIAKPTKDRAPSWKAREGGRNLSCSGVDARLGGHYYLVSGDVSDDCG